MKTTKTTTENLTLQNLFGIVIEENGVEINITVYIRSNKDYGWFEMYDEETGGEGYYVEGVLWFEGNKLVSYDGVLALPHSIIEVLKDKGYDVSYAE